MFRFAKSVNQQLNNWNDIIVNDKKWSDIFDQTSITKFPKLYDN